MTRRTILAAALILAMLAIGSVAGAQWQRGRGEPPLLNALEIGFSQDMATHHEQAITLCDALPRDVDAAVSGICVQIRATQLNEIGMMRGWLLLLDQPQASATPMAWMSGDGAHGGHRMGSALMPGMATFTEVDQLRRSTGRAAETQFLQLMIRHHRGGVDMANYAAVNASAMPVVQIARQMVGEQGEEIVAMSLLLDRLGAKPLAYP